LAGKVLASGVAGIVQLAVWAAAGFFVSAQLFSGSSTSTSAQTLLDIGNALSPPIVAAFAAFFVLGFLQYALLFAGAASLISRTEDLGSVTVPMVLPAVAAVMISQFALASPAAPVVVVCSFVPLLSPFIMFTRMLIAEVPAWQVATAFAINAGALAAIIPIAGKLYRVGLLLYGRAPKIGQIWAVLRS
jgi:ABC-2 type transport system permease protein